MAGDLDAEPCPSPGPARPESAATSAAGIASSLISQIGTWMQSVAQSWLVLQLTDSPFRLGLIGTLQFAPDAACCRAGRGAIADRLAQAPRCSIAHPGGRSACQSLDPGARSSRAATSSTGTSASWPWLAGLANTLDMPARQSYVAELVGRDDADAARSPSTRPRSTSPASWARPWAGCSSPASGSYRAFFINGLSFLGGRRRCCGTLKIDGRPAHSGARTRWAEEIRRGAEPTRCARRASASRWRCSSSCQPLRLQLQRVRSPRWLGQVLGLGAEGFGFLMAAMGVGAVAGALALGTLVPGRPPPVGALRGGHAWPVPGSSASSMVRQFAVAVPVLFVVGFFGIIATAGSNTTLQLSAPDRLRGRVMSIYTLIFGGSFPIASFLIGLISERWSVQRGLPDRGRGGAGARRPRSSRAGGWPQRLRRGDHASGCPG